MRESLGGHEFLMSGSHPGDASNAIEMVPVAFFAFQDSVQGAASRLAKLFQNPWALYHIAQGGPIGKPRARHSGTLWNVPMDLRARRETCDHYDIQRTGHSAGNHGISSQNTACIFPHSVYNATKWDS